MKKNGMKVRERNFYKKEIKQGKQSEEVFFMFPENALFKQSIFNSIYPIHKQHTPTDIVLSL